MLEDKFKIVKWSLTAAAMVHILSVLVSMFRVYQALSVAGIAEGRVTADSMASLVFSLVYPLAFCVAVAKSLQGLKEGNPYYWILSLFLGLFSLGSFAAPFGLIAILVLMDKRVRGPFIEKLDLQY